MSSRKKNKMFNPQATPFTMPIPNPPANPTPIQWSTVKITSACVEKLRLLCHSQKELKKEGYVLKPLDTSQIEAKVRCIKCRKRASRKQSQTASVLVQTRRDPKRPFCDKKAGGCGRPGHTVDKCFHLHPELKRGWTKVPPPTTGAVPLTMKKRSGACQYHIGRVQNKHFTCCGRHVSEEGCVEDDEHDLPAPNDPNVTYDCQYHYTPTPPPTRSRSRKGETSQPSFFNPWADPYAPPPHPATAGFLLPATTHLPAIALDCEMGTSKNLEPELIRITAVDFFSGAILIDNLVQPTVPMIHYNTKYSGVTASMIRDAVCTGTAINGRDRTRLALLEFVGPDTVVLVHGGSGDFSALRWIHPNIVDTFILEGYTGVKFEGGNSLQNLCKVKLGLEVQKRDPVVGKLGHDSYEDAMATRELVIQWLKGIPDA